MNRDHLSLGPVMLDIEGVELQPEERELLLHPLVGGLILFSRNFESTEQLAALTREIHALRQPRLLIAVDHEGGRVQRFREGFTALPAARRIGEVYDHDHRRGRRLAEAAGWVLAAELRATGLDFSFTPVLDVDYGCCEVIGNRAFHRDPEAIGQLAFSVMSGLSRAGMAAVGKHFPGHGGVVEDSHVAIPRDSREAEEIFREDVVPFRHLIGSGLPAIMPAHVIYEKVDDRPAGFSRVWLQDILRGRLGFEGVIFSDDLNMAGAGAIAAGYAERANAAVAAGCDVVLICNNRAGAVEILDHADFEVDPQVHLRMVRLHGRHDIHWAELTASEEWQQATELLRRYQDDATLELDFN